EKVLGSGTVVAMVTTELDFSSQEVSEITYGEPVLRSRSRSQEVYDGTAVITGGAAGSDSNLSYPTPGTKEDDSSLNKLDEIDNYEVPEKRTVSIKAPGEIKSLSASVIYDNSRGTLTTRQMEDLENLV